jgi:uncharacterized protein (TIGR03435 family)
MTKLFALGAFAALLLNAADNLQFDAVSIHPSAPDARGGGYNISPGRLTVKNQTLKDMVKFAYDLQDYQVSGGPNWVDGDHYQIEATYPPNASSADRAKMMQAMLADRFGLTVHREPRDVSGYALVVNKNGPKLQKSAATEPGMMLGRSPSSGLRMLTGTQATMSGLATLLSGLLNRPVEDKTSLDGIYDFKMEWQPDPTIESSQRGFQKGDAAPTPDRSGPTIFTALQESLGLRLENAKQSVDAIVIDHAEKPSAN